MDTNETMFVNASDLAIGQLIHFCGSDYAITGISLLDHDEQRKVMVVVEPMKCDTMSYEERKRLELILLVPQNTPFETLK